MSFPLYKSYADLPFFEIKSNNIKRKISESYGIAVVCPTTQHELLVRPLQTAAFVLFFRGVYHLLKVSSLVSQLTSEEYDKLLICLDNEEFYNKLFEEINYVDSRFHNASQPTTAVRTYAYSRLKDAESLLRNCERPLLLETSFSHCRGQKNYRETPLECAYREFLEETGINLKLLHHTLTKEEIKNTIYTPSGLEYTSHIFVIHVEEEFVVMELYDRGEICEIKWLPLAVE